MKPKTQIQNIVTFTANEKASIIKSFVFSTSGIKKVGRNKYRVKADESFRTLIERYGGKIENG